jgi:hypothetical protein
MDAKGEPSAGTSSASSHTLQGTLTSSDARIIFSLATTNVPKAKEFQRMLDVLPPSVKDIKVKVHSQKLLDSFGLFQGNSALAFLSVPVWLWCAMPTNPTYKYIGLVRSRNLLEEARREAEQQPLNAKYCSIGMQTEDAPEQAVALLEPIQQVNENEMKISFPATWLTVILSIVSLPGILSLPGIFLPIFLPERLRFPTERDTADFSKTSLAVKSAFFTDSISITKSIWISFDIMLSVSLLILFARYIYAQFQYWLRSSRRGTAARSMT